MAIGCLLLVATIKDNWWLLAITTNEQLNIVSFTVNHNWLVVNSDHD